MSLYRGCTYSTGSSSTVRILHSRIFFQRIKSLHGIAYLAPQFFLNMFFEIEFDNIIVTWVTAMH